MRHHNSSRKVYSTESGRICPDCSFPLQQCRCKAQSSAAVLNAESDGVVRISRETKGRKGAGVTLVNGVIASADELKVLAKKLKQQCSSGGAVKDGVIEIQGDHRAKVASWLEKQGYRVVLAGG